MTTRIAIFLVSFYFMNSGILIAQDQNALIFGTIKSENNESIPGITLVLDELNKGTATDNKGNYLIEKIDPGQYKLKISGIGYQNQIKHINLESGEKLNLDFILKESTVEMEEVIVRGKSEVQRIKKKPFSINVIDAIAFQNSNSNVSDLLGQTTGINIRENGGLGSDFEFSINGLSGRQVKFFLDGIPMDQFGSAMSINNIPVNLLDRIEVYKGVVPVHLGADALGGAINIITNQAAQNYVDASYSHGSFNTHKASINTQYTHSSTGLSVNLNSFYNYSDNDYKVDVEIPDELGNLDGNIVSVRRFHDHYRSAMAQLKVGVRDKNYADQLYVGLTYAGNKDNVQHGVSMERVFGKVYETDEMLMPTLEYSKKGLFNREIELNSYVSYVSGQFTRVDTSSRTYNWYGDYTIKNNLNLGEAQWDKTLFNFQDKTFISNNNVIYKLTEEQQVVLNHTANILRRQGDDPLDPDIIPFEDPNFLKKQVFGLSYKSNLMNGRWPSTIFFKYYDFQTKSIDVDWDNSKTIVEKIFNEPGYGFASTFYLNEAVQFKLSYEHAFRLPEGYEIFGDGLLLKNNPYLEPEESDNINLGTRYTWSKSDNKLTLESNVFYRNSQNLIRINTDGGVESNYENVQNATSSGLEMELMYDINNKIYIGTNATYQHIINKSKYDEDGKLNHVYLDRIPNIPYLFGNFNIGYKLKNFLQDNDKLYISGFSRYVHQYFLHWPSQGHIKHVIPTQLVHNLEIRYSFMQGKYNLTGGCSNLLDAKVYDKFRVQKPGRAFYFKLRYFINQ